MFMDTTDILINTPTPPADSRADFKRIFQELANKFHAVSTDVHEYEDGLHTTYIARFAETKYAAQFAAFFRNTAGLDCRVESKPIMH
jgi:hypothetical protein